MHDSLHPLTIFSPSHPHTSPPPTTYTNFTVANASVLPENISHALKSLDQELKEGDLTEKGYLKRKFHLLEPFKHLFVAGNKSNGRAAHTTTTQQHSVEGGGRGGGHSDSVEGGEQGGGGERQERNTANGKRYFILSSQLHTHLTTLLQATGNCRAWNCLMVDSVRVWGGGG